MWFIFAQKSQQMKHFVFSMMCAATLFSAGTANAQLGVKKVTSKIVPKVTIGVKLGMNMQKLDGTQYESKFKSGIVGGAFVSVDRKKVGIRVEGLLKSAKYTQVLNNMKVNALYVDVPLLLEYKIVPRLWIQAGPQFSSMLTAKNTNGDDVKSRFNTNDVSAVIGIEAALPLKLTVGARYIYGFNNLNEGSFGGELKSRSLQFSIGYRFMN
jgi:hypothetical protein